MKFPGYLALSLIVLALVGCSSSSTPSDQETPADLDSPMDPGTPVDQESPVEPGTPVDPGTDEPAPPGIDTPNEVRYRITFDADWTADRHPVQFPGASAHFSGLVGAVHNEQVIFWQPGQIASAGIEQMAETGGKSSFLDEINNSIANGYALAAINGSGISTGNGQASVEVLVTQDYSQITLTSMLAPSPDWFVGLHNYELFDGTTFVDMATVDAVLYDSGTDSGVSYTSGNLDTQPRDPILETNSDPADTSFVDGLPAAGRFIIERL